MARCASALSFMSASGPRRVVPIRMAVVLMSAPNSHLGQWFVNVRADTNFRMMGKHVKMRTSAQEIMAVTARV